MATSWLTFLQLELLNESRTAVVRPQKGRFVVSYALWEEKFSVTQIESTPGVGPRTVEGSPPRPPRPGVSTTWPSARWGWRRTGPSGSASELRTGTARDFADEAKIGISIHDLIEFLGRKNTEITHWGPLETRVRLADLPRMAGRGSRNG